MALNELDNVGLNRRTDSSSRHFAHELVWARDTKWATVNIRYGRAWKAVDNFHAGMGIVARALPFGTVVVANVVLITRHKLLFRNIGAFGKL